MGWLGVLAEETDEIHARAAAELYLRLSRGWQVLPVGTVVPLQWTANYASATNDEAAPLVDQELQRLRGAGFLLTLAEAQERFPSLRGLDRPTVILAMGCVVKVSAGRLKTRVVLDASAPRDGSSLNAVIEVPESKFTSVRHARAGMALMRREGEPVYQFKADLVDAFLQHPCSEATVPLLGVQWRDEFLVYVRMPFGVASAPAVQQTTSCAIARAVMRRWQAAGLTCGPAPGYDHAQAWPGRSQPSRHRDGEAAATSDTTVPSVVAAVTASLYVYLDDFLGHIRGSKAEADKAYGIFLDTCSELGVVVQDNPLKTHPPTLGPCEFLGIVFTQDELQLSPERVARMVTTLTALRGRDTVTLRELQSVVGVLQFAAVVLPAAVPFYQQLLAAKRGFGARPSPFQRIPVTTEMTEDFDMWVRMLTILNGRPIAAGLTQPRVHARLWTDSCFLGGGYFFGGRYRKWRWPESWDARFRDEGNWEVTMAELEAWSVLIALRDVLPLCAPAPSTQIGAGRTLTVMIDNQGVVAMCRRLSSRSARCNVIMREIAVLCTIFSVTLDPQWLPSADNEAADMLSRAREPAVTEQRLATVMQEWSAREPSTLHWRRRPAPRAELYSVLTRALFD